MKNLISSFFGAIVFYTIIPLPSFIPIDFRKIALWLPIIGIILGGLLTGINYLLGIMGFSGLVKAVMIVACWIYLTGGLHLDGVMDTADGLAVQNPDKRLEIMGDSHTGAYGVMAGIVVILLKIACLSQLDTFLGFYLILATTSARWGQFSSIVLYPYLKKEGKGAFLRQGLNLPLDGFISSFFFLSVFFFYYLYFHSLSLSFILPTLFIPLFMGWWFYRKLGGHTGDTYGATIEWSEAFILLWLTRIS